METSTFDLKLEQLILSLRASSFAVLEIVVTVGFFSLGITHRHA